MKMKRAFMILMALVFIFNLSFIAVFAQESDEGEVEGERIERDPDKPEVRTVPERPIRSERIRDDVERLYRKLFSELERQRNEIHALRKEIAELRRMLEKRYEPERLEWQKRWSEDWEPRLSEIEAEIRELEERLKREVDNIELRMRLADLYRKLGKKESAIKQYRKVLEIAPDFDPPYRALKEMGYKFEKREPEEFSVGDVISTNEKGITLKTLEGDTMTFNVPHWQKDDGSWMLDEKLSKLAKSLKPNTRIRIIWHEVEGDKVIRRIESGKDKEIKEGEEESGEYNIGDVISASQKEVTIKTLEGDNVTYRIPAWQKDDGLWVLDEDIMKAVNSLKKGKRVKIYWHEMEGHKVIRHIEMMEKEQY